MKRLKYFIVAANCNEFFAWKSSNRPAELIPEYNDPNYHVELYYVSSPDSLRGLNDIKGFYLPGCEHHPQYQEIKNLITTIKHFANAPVNTGTISYNTSTNSVVFGHEITGVILDEMEDIIK